MLERGDYVPREKDNWSPRAVNIEAKYNTKEVWRDRDGQPLHPHTNYYVGGNTKFYGQRYSGCVGRTKEGITLLDRCRAVWAERHNGQKHVGLRTPQGERVVEVGEILVAAGRQPNTEDLGLEQVGVSFDERGMHIDRRCRTNIPSIWADG